MATAGSSSTRPEGFELQRRLGETTWQALQPELGRRVALHRLAPGTAFQASRWPEGRGIVGLYAAVETPDGTYVATRFVDGARTLAELRGARPARRRRWLEEAAAILAGTTHGNLTAHDILIDSGGQVLVTGFGRPPATDDAEALAALLPPAGRRRRPLLVIPAVAIIVIAVLLLRGDAGLSAPAVTAGTTAFGSALAPGAFDTVDCEGREPNGSSQPCTIMQGALPGRRLAPTRPSLVRGWAVRGAHGTLQLQILRHTARGYTLFNSSRPRTVTDDGPHYFTADRSVPAGAVFALEVTPGSGVGLRHRAGAATRRFFGPATSFPPRPGDTDGGARQELLLRVDVVPRFG